MFGLTKREQRWKAEQEAAEVLVGLAAVAVRTAADVRIAEANAELERLRKEVAELRASHGAAPACGLTVCNKPDCGMRVVPVGVMGTPALADLAQRVSDAGGVETWLVDPANKPTQPHGVLGMDKEQSNG